MTGQPRRSTGQNMGTDTGTHYLATSALASRMGIEIVEANVQRVVGTMPVEGNTQPFGLLHGGASCVLAESLGSTAAYLHAATIGDNPAALGVDLNATHHRAVRSGLVTGVATPIHLGRTITTHDVTITDAKGRRVCTVRITNLLRFG